MKSVKCIMLLSCLVLTPVLVFSASLPPYDVLPFIDEGIKGPGRIAVCPNGWVYVSDFSLKKVSIYSPSSELFAEINDNIMPRGVACDTDGTVYVGDFNTKGIRVYSSAGAYIRSFGVGTISKPMDIKVAANGNVYVVDTASASVSVFNQTGTLVNNFGVGNLKRPTGIDIDDPASEVYVSDPALSRIFVFDLNGVHVRDIFNGQNCGMMGCTDGNFATPQGLALDADRLYVAASYYGKVAVHGKDGAYLGDIASYGTEPGELRIPIDVGIDNSGRLIVANLDNDRLEIFGIDNNYTEWSIVPSRIDLTVYENGNPVTQGVTVSANKTLSFTVQTNASWLTVSPDSGTTGDSITVLVDPSLMSEGSYSGRVIVASGQTENVVPVNVTVLRDYSMIVTPGSLTLTYQKGSDSVPAGTILVDTGGSNFSWTASTAEGWIGLDKTSGSTSSDSTITVTPDVSGLNVGTYQGVVDIAAGAGVTGSPVSVDIMLNVVKAGSIVVNSNLDQASFTITGPETYSGSGKVWSAGDVTQGRYEIVFDHVPGYIKPAARHFYVQSGKEVLIDATYKTKKAANSIAALSSGADADTVSIIDSLSGAPIVSFNIPVGNAEIGTGDYDGDGIDEIAVLSNGQSLKLYEYDGTEAGSLDFAGTVKGITSTDLNGDGEDDLIIAVHNKRGISVRVIYLADCGAVGNKKLIRASGSGDSTIASGDFNGDGIADIAIADSSSVQVYDISSRKSRKMISFAHQSVNVPQITAGDLDDNGIYEIIVSEEDITSSNSVRILNADGSDYTVQIGLTGYTGVADVTSGDTDNDGLVEIVVADTASDEVKVFEDNGSGSGTMDTLTGSTGIRVAVGGF